MKFHWNKKVVSRCSIFLMTTLRGSSKLAKWTTWTRSMVLCRSWFSTGLERASCLRNCRKSFWTAISSRIRKGRHHRPIGRRRSPAHGRRWWVPANDGRGSGHYERSLISLSLNNFIPAWWKDLRVLFCNLDPPKYSAAFFFFYGRTSRLFLTKIWKKKNWIIFLVLSAASPLVVYCIVPAVD